MLRCNIFIQQALEHTIKCHYGIYTHTYTCTKNIDFGQLHTPWGNHYRSTVSNFSLSKLNVILQPAKTRNQSVWLLSEVGFWTMADKLHMSLFPAPFRLQLHFFSPFAVWLHPPTVIMLHIIPLIICSMHGYMHLQVQNAPHVLKCEWKIKPMTSLGHLVMQMQQVNHNEPCPS